MLVLSRLQAPDSWSAVGQQATALAILSGSASQEELRYLKSTSLHLWLFGYELPGLCALCMLIPLSCALSNTAAMETKCWSPSGEFHSLQCCRDGHHHHQDGAAPAQQRQEE